MRIFMIGSDPKSGLLYHLVRLALEFKRKEHEVHVGTWGTLENTPGITMALVEAGITLHTIPSLHLHGARAVLSRNNDLRFLPEQLGARALQMFGPVTAFQTRRRKRSEQSARRVCMVASMGSTLGNNWRVRLGSALLNSYVDDVVALCENESRRLAAAGVNRDKIRIVYNPLDCADILAKGVRAQQEGRENLLARYGLSTGARWLGYFANFWAPKRHDVLLNAFAAISRDFPDWNLVLAGEGTCKDECRLMAAALGIAEKVTFLPRLPHSELIGLLSCVDAVVHCSGGETFGYSIIEPLLLGKPLVTARAGIAYEIEAADQAIVVSPGSVEELIGGLKRLLRGDGDVVQRALTSSAYVQRTFDVRVIADRLLELYEAGPV